MNLLALRDARPDDAPLLSLLAIHVYVQTYATLGLRPIFAREVFGKFSVEAWKKEMTRDGVEVIVAERDGHLIGFAQLAHRATNPQVATARPAELERLYVQERFTGRGVGRRLLEDAERRAAGTGAGALWLTAWVGNPRALGFYASCGYEDVGAWLYRFEDETFENRVFLKRL